MATSATVPATHADGTTNGNYANTTGTVANDYGANQRQPHQQRDWGNPLAHVATNDSQLRVQAFGGAFQPGLYRPPT